MNIIKPFLNTIIHGDCINELQKIPAGSIDTVFADPPYNLQLKKDLYRPNQTKVNGVDDQWDKFNSFQDYDEFTRSWLDACRRVLKDDGTIWVIGSYHNIYRIGKILQDLGFWILNDVIWVKTNPMPNFRGTRFTNAHETLIWAARSEKSKYTFHHKSMKSFNDDKQMRSDWCIPICSGGERLKENGKKAHSTQKPELLLYRVILSSTNVGDIVLDPFMGSGTTGAIAKKTRRHFIGIEKEADYINIAQKRITRAEPGTAELYEYYVEYKPPKVPFGDLIGVGLINVGEIISDKKGENEAVVLADASIRINGEVGSIHKVSAGILNRNGNNGWSYWYVKRNNELISIDELRAVYREKYLN